LADLFAGTHKTSHKQNPTLFRAPGLISSQVLLSATADPAERTVVVLDRDGAASAIIAPAWVRSAVFCRIGDFSVEINGPFLFQLKGTPAEYKAGLERAIANGWLWLHESGTYVKISEER